MYAVKIVTFIFILTSITEHLKADTQCAKGGSSRSPIAQIKEKILCNYNKDYRPVKNQSRAINVKIRMVLKSLDVTDEDNTFQIHHWMGIIWKDEFLTWNPKDFNSLTSIHISSSEIWTPDLKILRKHKNDQSAIAVATDCIVHNTGAVSCVSDNLHEAQCTSNLERWPYDTRLCSIRYGTGIHNSSQVRLSEKLTLSVYFQNPSWQLKNSSTTLYNSKNSMNNETSNYVNYQFQLQRHSARATAIIFVPVFTLATMTLLPLWIKPDSVERLCLVASNIMSHFLFIEHLSYVVPLSGSALPLIVSFFRDSLGLSVAVLIELTLIKSLISNRSASPPKLLLTPCKFVSNAFFGGDLLTVEISEATTIDMTSENGIQSENNKEAKNKKLQGDKYMIATVIDRFIFLLLSVVYFILTICLIPY